MLFFSSYLFSFFSSYLFLFFFFLHILIFLYLTVCCITDMRIKHTQRYIKNGKINDLQRKPRKNSSLAKNPPKYTTAYIVL